ncbi:MAG: hypothetical protein Q9166_004789, partial [cf. Caloplaca sp. 2 TL-2023]
GLKYFDVPNIASRDHRFSVINAIICDLNVNPCLSTSPSRTHLLSNSSHRALMSDKWFQEQIAPDGLEEDGCHPDEAQALKDYYHQRTGASEAAYAITRPIENSENPGGYLYRLWNLLIDALMQLPETQVPALIQLLDAIQTLPEPDLTGRITQDTPVGGYLWRGLPGFGHMWADEHKRDDWRRTLAAEKSASRADMRAAHVRKAGIEARLAVAGIGGIPLHWGYDCIADALERRDAGVVMDFEIPAAAEWITVAERQLYAGAVNGSKSWALEKRRDFGKEAAGMNVERWLFWEERLNELQRRAEAVVGAAEAADQVMKSIRRGGD